MTPGGRARPPVLVSPGAGPAFCCRVPQQTHNTVRRRNRGGVKTPASCGHPARARATWLAIRQRSRRARVWGRHAGAGALVAGATRAFFGWVFFSPSAFFHQKSPFLLAAPFSLPAARPRTTTPARQVRKVRRLSRAWPGGGGVFGVVCGGKERCGSTPGVRVGSVCGVRAGVWGSERGPAPRLSPPVACAARRAPAMQSKKRSGERRTAWGWRR